MNAKRLINAPLRVVGKYRKRVDEWEWEQNKVQKNGFKRDKLPSKKRTNVERSKILH